jgi:hypothetical protein
MEGSMGRQGFFLSLLVVAFAAVIVRPAGSTGPQEGESIVVLPLRAVGVSDTTIAVTRDLLAGELEARGANVRGLRDVLGDLPRGTDGCDEIECALELGGDLNADVVVFGSLSRLGEKIIARIRAIRVVETEPFYRDQLTAVFEEDLDRVMLRVAEGIVAGRPDSKSPTVESVIMEEVHEPRLRASRKGLGIRAGFIFPVEDSYAGADRVTTLRIPFKYETTDYFIETTTLLGLSFARSFDIAEWTILDLYGARILGLGDHAGFVGGGIGIHSVHLERNVEETCRDDGCHWPSKKDSESATTLVLDLGGGLLGLRTFDFEIVIDLRYHYVFEDFDRVDGNGAHGFILSFGTHR